MKFLQTSCSQCGGTFGPGDAGFSSCAEHAAVAAVDTRDTEIATLRELVEDVARSWVVTGTADDDYLADGRTALACIEYVKRPK